MLLPRIFGWGRDRASRGARLSARLGPSGTWRVRFESVLRIPGWKVGGRGDNGLSFLERNRAGWERRSPLSLSPFLCGCSKSTFAPLALGAPRVRFFPLYPLLFLFFPFPQLCSCRWWLEKFCRYRQKSFGDTGSTETPEMQAVLSDSRLFLLTPPQTHAPHPRPFPGKLTGFLSVF